MDEWITGVKSSILELEKVIRLQSSKIEELEKRVKWNEGSIGMLANAEQYSKATIQDNKERSKLLLNWAVTRNEFQDWAMVQETLKGL